ncbi:MAG TPA: 16S rRNA (cytidine(1402)-2'-O)-methyltransferase [Pyrinomonadaceae bacterium]
MFGTLYLVATPIGNLQDITFRAVEILKTVDLIACEDTRHTRKLLTHYGISNRLVSYHEHNEHERAEELAARLQDGKSIAVVSDAGTPAICDPAFRIVQKAHEIGAPVVSIPGAAAFVSALIISGLPTDSMFFGGFLPSRKSERQKRLAEVKEIPATLVFYETPHRLAKSLADCAEVLGNRKGVVVRELTKLHEETVRGNLAELAKSFSEKTVKGEIVLVIDREENQRPKTEDRRPASVALRVKELEKDFDHKTALKKAAREFGLSRSEAYRILISEKNR